MDDIPLSKYTSNVPNFPSKVTRFTFFYTMVKFGLLVLFFQTILFFHSRLYGPSVDGSLVAFLSIFEKIFFKSLNYCAIFLLLRLLLHGWKGFKDHFREVGNRFLRLRLDRRGCFILAQRRGITKLRWFFVPGLGIACFFSSIVLFLCVYPSIWIITVGMIVGCITIQWQTLREQYWCGNGCSIIACTHFLKTKGFVFASILIILYIVILHIYHLYGDIRFQSYSRFFTKVVGPFIDFVGPFVVFPCWLHLILGRRPSLLESEFNTGWYDELGGPPRPVPWARFVKRAPFKIIFLIFSSVMLYFIVFNLIKIIF